MDIKELQKKVIEFGEERDWAQYHNPKDLAISLSLEAADLLGIFQLKDPQEVSSQGNQNHRAARVTILDSGQGLRKWLILGNCWGGLVHRFINSMTYLFTRD